MSIKPVHALFLDVDGVLTPMEWFTEELRIERHKLFPKPGRLSLLETKILRGRLLDETAVGNLHDLIHRISEVAEVRIVLSSSWRVGLTVGELTEEVFRNWEFSRYLIDTTPYYTSSDDRWSEIRQWLSENGERHRIEKFIILDDYYPYNFPEGHYIKVDPERLLTGQNVVEAFFKFQSQNASKVSKAKL